MNWLAQLQVFMAGRSGSAAPVPDHRMQFCRRAEIVDIASAPNGCRERRLSPSLTFSAALAKGKFRLGLYDARPQA